MKRTMLTALSALALAVPAFAAPQMYVGMNYLGSYDVDGNSVDALSYDTQVKADGTNKLVFSGAIVGIHEFEVTISISGLAAGEDFMKAQYNPKVTGDVALNGDVLPAYEPALPSINPPKMPTPTGSDAPAGNVFQANQYNGAAFLQAITPGSTQTGNGNGTYGDYAAALQLGELAPYTVGTLRLTASGAGEYEFAFLPNPGYLNIITGNTNGLATSTNLAYPAYEGLTDTVQFVVPEPASMSLLALGGLALLRRARRA